MKSLIAFMWLVVTWQIVMWAIWRENISLVAVCGTCLVAVLATAVRIDESRR